MHFRFAMYHIGCHRSIPQNYASQLITEYVDISSPSVSFVRYIKWHNVCGSQSVSFYCFGQGNITDYSSTHGEDKTNAKCSRRQPSFFRLSARFETKNSLKKIEERKFLHTEILPSCSFPISQFKND